jgi:hypothetical protein
MCFCIQVWNFVPRIFEWKCFVYISWADDEIFFTVSALSYLGMKFLPDWKNCFDRMIQFDWDSCYGAPEVVLIATQKNFVQTGKRIGKKKNVAISKQKVIVKVGQWNYFLSMNSGTGPNPKTSKFAKLKGTNWRGYIFARQGLPTFALFVHRAMLWIADSNPRSPVPQMMRCH